jgi:hypothetical protein
MAESGAMLAYKVEILNSHFAIVAEPTNSMKRQEYEVLYSCNTISGFTCPNYINGISLPSSTGLGELLIVGSILAVFIVGGIGIHH